MEAEHKLESGPTSPKAALTGRQKWLIAGLILLQVPSSAVFYPLAAVLSLTGIGVPLSIVLVGIGTMPYSSAMKRKVAWQSGWVPERGGDRREAIGPATQARSGPASR